MKMGRHTFRSVCRFCTNWAWLNSCWRCWWHIRLSLCYRLTWGST